MAFRGIRICWNCGEKFNAKHPNSKFCFKSECLDAKKKRANKMQMQRINNSDIRKSTYTKSNIYYKIDKRLKVYNRTCLKCNNKFKTNYKFIRLCQNCKLVTKNYITENDFRGGVVG